MITSVELTWWDNEENSFSLPLEPFQLWAIHQILGLQITEQPNGSFAVSHFSEETVRKRVKAAGILVEPEGVD